MTRLRSAAQRAPQTTEAATLLLARLAEVDALIAAHEAQRTAQLAGINGAADACIIPLDAERKDLAKQLKPWFEVNFETLTGGKRKSIELGGCTIGYRLSPPKLSFAYGTDKDAVAALEHFDRTAGLVRVTPALNKPALLTELADGGDGDAIPVELLGFEATQSEDFFIEPIVAGVGPA